MNRIVREHYPVARLPEDLREVHRQNDEVVERIYFGRRMKNDTDRLEHLFMMYRKVAG